MILYILALLFVQTPEVPFRAKDDFQVELKYNLKQQAAKDGNSAVFDVNRVSDRSAGALPYLIVHVTILNHKDEEIRFKCENNFGHALFNKKAEKSLKYVIDMGYIDDIKDRVSPYQYTLTALSDKRDVLNKIELQVLEDGTFLVNGEKRGKF